MVFDISQGVHLEFAAEHQVGFKNEGEVVIKEKAKKTLHEYTLQIRERNVYQKSKSGDFPSGVNDASIRSSSGPSILLQDKNTATLKLSFHNLNFWKRCHHEGIILPCSGRSGTERMYAMEKTDGEYEIINNDDRFKAVLQPVAGRPTWKDPYLCVCVDGSASDIKMAVTSRNHTLDIYYRNTCSK